MAVTRREEAVRCRWGGVERRLRIGDTFEVASLSGPLTLEVTDIKWVSHTDEETGYRWDSRQAVCRIVGGS